MIKLSSRIKTAAILAVMAFHTISILPNQVAAQVKRYPGAKSNKQRVIAAREKTNIGNFYYANYSVDDEAIKIYKQVITQYADTPSAEEAQYYLGKYYQQKFYIYSEKWGKGSTGDLDEAEDAFQHYIKLYSSRGSRRWLSDSLWNLALVRLQQNKRGEAIDKLREMLVYAKRDQKVCVRQIVWTSNSKDLIDYEFDAAQLAQFAKSLAENNLGFGQIVEELKKWCRGQMGNNVPKNCEK